MTKLSDAALSQALVTLEGWRSGDDRLYREFTFKDFRTAIAFMQDAADTCERMDHHPDWLNSYKRVRVWLTTHSENGITAKDIQLAAALSTIAARHL